MKIDKVLIETSIQAPIGSAMLEPDSRVIQRETWYQIITPSVKDPSANEVIISRVPDAEAESRIEETFSMYREHQVPFKWCIGPMSNTSAIEPKIQSRASESWRYRGMIAESKMDVSYPDTIIVDRVTSSNFEEFMDVFLVGWGMERFREAVRDKLEQMTGPNTSYPYYLATQSGIPIGAAGTVLKNGYGYLVGAIVLNEFRGSGAYRALLHGRLKDLESRGMPHAITHAREATSAPILEKLGFATTFHAKVYRFT